MHNLSLCPLQQSLQPPKVSLIDHPRHPILPRLAPRKRIRRLFRIRQKQVFTVGRANDNDVVGPNTNLSGIGEFPPHDARSKQLEFGVRDGGVDDAGILAAEFECVGGEILGCCCGDEFGSLGSTRIDDVVPPFVEEGRSDGNCTGHDGENVGGKVFRGEFGDEGGRMRSMFGGLFIRHNLQLKDLQDDGVSCGEGIDGGTETTPHGVIPRSHDKHRPQRFLAEPRLVEFKRNRDGDVFLLCPFIDLS
jgi:hypothetical protein